MATEPPRFRPSTYPPPEFPPRRPAAFARTPPAIFPVLLGFLGLALALRAGFAAQGWPAALPDLAAGLALAVWAFGALAYGAKLVRRPGVLAEELKVMPARAGLAAGTAGGMAAAAVLAPFAPGVALAMLIVALALHLGLAVLVLRLILAAPPEARAVNPGWHIVFVGFIVGAMAAALLGRTGLAEAILWPTLAIATAIWAASLAQLRRGLPPPPLRPMLAIHLAPASLFATVAVLTGHPLLALVFGALSLGIFAALVLAAPRILAAGVSPLWGALTFPLAAFAGAMIRLGGAWGVLGLAVLAIAAVAIPAIGWAVLRLWPKGTLAAKTNAAEA